MNSGTKNRIIVCGYPKSGNTWLTRLTAEIVNCPVVGFWCEPFCGEQAVEGLDRKSDYQCFKAHHGIDNLGQTLALYANGSEKVIYIVRDPRDVVVSASHYFTFAPRYRSLYKLMSRMPYGLRAYQKYFDSQQDRLDIVTKTLIDGTSEREFYLRIPWGKHVEGYVSSGFLVIKYEELRKETLREARRICEYLNIERSDQQLSEAIDNQSFDRKKKAFLNSEQKQKARLFREGASGGWREKLSAENVRMIDESLGDLLKQLGYE